MGDESGSASADPFAAAMASLGIPTSVPPALESSLELGGLDPEITLADGPLTLHRGDELLVQRENDAAPTALRMDGPADHFTFRGYTVKFVRDSARKVTGFTVDAGRVRGIVFERQER